MKDSDAKTHYMYVNMSELRDKNSYSFVNNSFLVNKSFINKFIQLKNLLQKCFFIWRMIPVFADLKDGKEIEQKSYLPQDVHNWTASYLNQRLTISIHQYGVNIFTLRSTPCQLYQRNFCCTKKSEKKSKESVTIFSLIFDVFVHWSFTVSQSFNYCTRQM